MNCRTAFSFSFMAMLRYASAAAGGGGSYNGIHEVHQLGNGARTGHVQMLAGVVAGEFLSADGNALADRPLRLARAIHAVFILDLIDRLPPPGGCVGGGPLYNTLGSTDCRRFR